MSTNHPPQVGQTRRLTFTGETFAVLDWEENRGPGGVFTIDAPSGAPDTYSVSTLHDVSTYVSGPTQPSDGALGQARVARAMKENLRGLDVAAAETALMNYNGSMIPGGIVPQVWMLNVVLESIAYYVNGAAERPAALIEIGASIGGGTIHCNAILRNTATGRRYKVTSPSGRYQNGDELTIVAIDEPGASAPRPGVVLTFDYPSPGIAARADVMSGRKSTITIPAAVASKAGSVFVALSDLLARQGLTVRVDHSEEPVSLDAPPAGTPPIYATKTSDLAPGIASLQDLAAPLHIAGKAGTALDRDTLANDYVARRQVTSDRIADLARDAYAFADAMIEESAKVQPVVTEAQAASYRDLAHAMAIAGGCPGTCDDLLTSGAAEVIRVLVAERETALANASASYAERVAAKANQSTLDKIADTVLPVRADGETVLGCVQRIVGDSRAAVELERASILCNVAPCYSALGDIVNRLDGASTRDPSVPTIRRMVRAAMTYLEGYHHEPFVAASEVTK